MSGSTKLKSGYTWRSFIGILYAIAIFGPAQIYLSLVTAGGIGGLSWFVLILLIELTSLSGSRLTKQEALLISLFANTSVAGIVGLVYREWFRLSPITKASGMVETVPWWYSPPLEVGVWDKRTFFHPAWIVPVTIVIVGVIGAGLASFGLGILAKEVFIEVENLPFPLQRLNAAPILTLTEGKTIDINVFSMSAVFGFIYGFIVYTLRFIAETYKLAVIPLVPIPWIDITHLTQDFFPGAQFGIATTLGSYLIAMVLSPRIVIGFIIGSFAVNFFGNWLSVNYGLYLERWWYPGMNIQQIMQRSSMYVWASPIIGIGIAAGIGPLLAQPALLRQLVRALTKPGKVIERRFPETFSLKLWLIPFFAMAIYSAVLIHLFAPGFPIWILLILNFSLPILMTFINTRMIGTVGVSVSIPHVNEMAILASGHKGTDIWYTLWGGTWTDGVEGSGWCTNFKLAELTETSMRSIFKMWISTITITLALAFIYMELFWKIAPIPSALYPATEIFWPVTATFQNIWLTRPPNLFRVDIILLGFFVTLGLTFATTFAKSPISIVPIAAGVASPVPTAMAMLIGLMFAQAIRKWLGSATFEKYRMVIPAGATVGEGVAIALGSSIGLISSSMWKLPY